MFFECQRCDGRAISLAVLRRVVEPECTKRLWQQAVASASRGPSCPSCRQAMSEVVWDADATSLHLDICRTCQFLWFDPHEFEQLRPKTPTEQVEERELSEEGRELIARANLRISDLRARDADYGREVPEEMWKLVPAMLGMPVEHDRHPVGTLPWITWGVVAAMVVATVLLMRNETVALNYGLIPAKTWRYGGLTLITSFFLHAGLYHLLANSYFLLIFGDNVEDYLGKLRYAAVLAAAALVGNLVHVLGEPRSEIPCVGASGGISGVIVYYALKFPHAKIGLMVLFRYLQIPAMAAILLWILLQTIGVYLQVEGVSNVSALAHLGGAAVGLLAWIVWRGV